MNGMNLPTVHRLRACQACAGTKLDPNDPDLPCRSCSSTSPNSSNTSDSPSTPSCRHQWRRRVVDTKLIRACQLCDAHGEEYEWRKHWRLNADKSVTCRLRGMRRRDRATSVRSEEVESKGEVSEAMVKKIEEENARVNVSVNMTLKRTQTGTLWQGFVGAVAVGA